MCTSRRLQIPKGLTRAAAGSQSLRWSRQRFASSSPQASTITWPCAFCCRRSSRPQVDPRITEWAVLQGCAWVAHSTQSPASSQSRPKPHATPTLVLAQYCSAPCPVCPVHGVVASQKCAQAHRVPDGAHSSGTKARGPPLHAGGPSAETRKASLLLSLMQMTWRLQNDADAVYFVQQPPARGIILASLRASRPCRLHQQSTVVHFCAPTNTLISSVN